MSGTNNKRASLPFDGDEDGDKQGEETVSQLKKVKHADPTYGVCEFCLVSNYKAFLSLLYFNYVIVFTEEHT